MAVQFKKLIATLPAGTNLHTFTDALINDASVIEVYTNNDDVYPTNLEQNGTSIVVEIVDHGEPVDVAITINNLVTFTPYDDTDIHNELNTISDSVSGLSAALNELSDNVDTLEGDVIDNTTNINSLSMDKQDKIIAGDNITIAEDGKTISASGAGQTEHAEWDHPYLTQWFSTVAVQDIYKNGKNVFFNVTAKTSQSIAQNTWTTIGTIPDGYKPSNNIYFPVHTGGRNIDIMCLINTSGSVRFYSASVMATGIKVHLNVSYCMN